MNSISLDTNKDTIFSSVEQYLTSHNLNIKEADKTRPWGGFFVIDDSSLASFVEHFFSDLELREFLNQSKLSPKILLVGPGKRLSWQYHFLRSEIWSIAAGEVGIVLSDDDEQPPLKKFKSGDQITIGKGERHRLVGLDEWGIVAEIWKHTDPENPSHEDDIVRLEDDFGR